MPNLPTVLNNYKLLLLLQYNGYTFLQVIFSSIFLIDDIMVGVTTIAGGYSQKAVRTDVPASDASLSNNFELTFIPQICALMISDHGNRLIHQINLKAADCKTHTGSGKHKICL